jgi:hypothetical protein
MICFYCGTDKPVDKRTCPSCGGRRWTDDEDESWGRNTDFLKQYAAGNYSASYGSAICATLIGPMYGTKGVRIK